MNNTSLYEAFNDTFDKIPAFLYKHDRIGSDIWAPLHWHRSLEILIAFEGRLSFNVGSENFDFYEDEWLIVNSSELHSLRYSSPSDHFKGITVMISYPFLETWIGKGLFFHNPHRESVTRELQQIGMELYALDESDPHFSLILMRRLFDLLLLLSSECIKEDVKYSVPFSKESVQAADILEYIEANYKNDLSLDDIASHFQYSSSYFSRFFKKCIGVNYFSYLNFVRVHHAAQQLLKDKSSLTECAMDNGFPNTKSFITIFKKLYGCTPKQFLNNH